MGYVRSEGKSKLMRQLRYTQLRKYTERKRMKKDEHGRRKRKKGRYISYIQMTWSKRECCSWKNKSIRDSCLVVNSDKTHIKNHKKEESYGEEGRGDKSFRSRRWGSSLPGLHMLDPLLGPPSTDEKKDPKRTTVSGT